MSEWKQIETAPKDGTSILLYSSKEPITEGWFETSLEWGRPCNSWTNGWETSNGCDVGYNRLYPTHWMPLPPPPNASECGAQPIKSEGMS